MNYRDIYTTLYDYTDGFRADSGEFIASDKVEQENAASILKNYYSIDDTYDKKQIDGTNYKIVFTKNLDPDVANSGPIGKGLGEALEKHDELNPDLWENDELKSEVKDKLLEIVNKFKENLSEDDIELDIKDIVIIGSNANYNYTEQSDIDLHIVADTSVYEDQKELAVKLYDAYKRLFNNKYDPTIYGHEVEIYVEPDNIRANSNGMYSLNTGWLKFPENTAIPELDEVELQSLVSDYEEKIQNADSIDEIDNVINDLYILRQQSILSDGEYGIGNQCFKEIRNLGLLKELKDKKVQLETEEMSLTEAISDNDIALLKSLGFKLYFSSKYTDRKYYVLRGKNNSQILIRTPETTDDHDWFIESSICDYDSDFKTVIETKFGSSLQEVLSKFCG